MKLILWFGGIILVFGLIIGYLLTHFSSLVAVSGAPAPAYSVKLNSSSVNVVLARTPAEQELGLGGRESLAPDEGMLFVFTKDAKYGFWMKNMKFAIDIIWLASDGTVVYIVPNLSPSTYPSTYAPPVPARFVLEVPAGWAADHGVHIGDRAELP